MEKEKPSYADLVSLLEAAADMQDSDGHIGCKLMEEIRDALAKATGAA